MTQKSKSGLHFRKYVKNKRRDGLYFFSKENAYGASALSLSLNPEIQFNVLLLHHSFPLSKQAIP